MHAFCALSSLVSNVCSHTLRVLACHSDKVSISKASKRIRRPSTHARPSRMPHTRPHRIISRPRRSLRIILISPLPLASKQRIIKSRMHASPAHPTETRPHPSIQRISRPQALRVQVAIAETRHALAWHHAASRRTQGFVLVLEAGHGFWHWSSRGDGEGIVERVWACRGVSVFS